LGFDAFYVKEQDVKNLGLYKPNQLKSAIGNTGAFSPETGKVRYSLRNTDTPAFKQWFGDSKVETGMLIAYQDVCLLGYDLKTWLLNLQDSKKRRVIY
jgi:outer membrane protein assembly factor BamB